MAFTHGASGYRNYACRCEICTRGNTERARTERANRRGKTPPKHGLYGYGNYGCRCDICSEAHSARMKAYHRDVRRARKAS